MKNLEELVSIKSFDTKQNKEIIGYLEKRFASYSKEIIKVKSLEDDREGLIIGLNTKLDNVKDAIVLSGHIDTVVADEKLYNTNPYSPTLIGDRMYGLGIIDMKSYFGCILDNLDKIKSLKKPVIIAITGDEETTLSCVKQIQNKFLERAIMPRVTMVGEPTNMAICSMSKGCAEFNVEIFGKSCHSSIPENGINANYILARLVLYIEKLCSKIVGTSVSCNVVSGGDKVNIVSGFAKLKFDIRSNSSKDSEKILGLIKKYIKRLEKIYPGAKIKLSQKLNIPPLERKTSQLIEKICLQFKLEEKQFTGGCEAGYFQEIGGDAFIFGVGDLALAHKPNEYVNINEYKEFSKTFMQVLNFCDKEI